MPMPTAESETLNWEADAIIQRYCAEHDRQPDEGADCLDALKQFLFVCSRGDGIRAPSEAIDDMWHTALLFTRSYQAFCAEQLGAYIHHEPVAKPAPASVYALTRDEANVIFGPLDDRFWSSVSEVARCGGCGSIYVP